MKKTTIVVIIIFLTLNIVFGQVPKSFKYQAVVRDNNGAITHNVSLQINIIQDTSVGGTIVYSETFTNIKPTNIGMVNLDIGKGTIVTGNFSKIDWGNHKFYIGINMDPNGGSNYQAMGTSELLSVPYALYAATAGNSGGSNLSFTGTGSTTVTGSYPNYTINSSYQYLRASNDTIYLTNGGFVKLPYTAGTGIGLTGTIINNSMPNAIHTGDAIGSGALTVVALQGNPINTAIPSNNQVLSWNGSIWTPSTININTYYAGMGLTLSGNTFIHTQHTGDATGQTNLTVIAIQGKAVVTTAPTLNQVLSWNGSNWTPTSNAGQPYYAGTGLSITGNTFYHLAHTGDAIGQTSITVVALQGAAISTITPTTNQVLSWNGSTWTPTAVGGIGGSGKSNLVTIWTGTGTISSDTNLYWDNVNKRLGIGTKSPRQNLELTGSMTLPDLTTYGYIYKGNNTFIHNYGTRNLFTGSYAGNLNLTGTDITGIGYGALYYNTSGKQNTAIGSQALYSNTTSSYNTAIGYLALYTYTSGLGSNTGIGANSLQNTTTGNGNTAVGVSTLNNNTTGNANIAIGVAALLANTTGGGNIAIGVQAASGCTSGTGNTVIGGGVLPTNSIGSNNTALGCLADVSANNLSNSTVIGYGAIVNASNKVRIGNTAVSVIEGQVSLSAASDMRFKKNIKDIGVGLDFVMKLRPVEYEVNTGDTRLNYGFIAQELLQLVGENNTLVNIGGDDAKTLSVRHTDLIAPVVKAIQEQQSLILNQQNQINDKQYQINDLKNENLLLNQKLNESNNNIDKIMKLLKKK